MASVELRKLTKSFVDPQSGKTVTAVDALNLEIRDGEFLVLVGPSGCGKSTALRMIAGLETVTSGDICINETRVNQKPPGERNIAMVFQNYALYPHLSVYDNMAFNLKLRHVPQFPRSLFAGAQVKAAKENIDKQVREVAEMLGITHLLERKPRALSGGQRQRVALGRAIVRHPEVFLMDEPLSNLDAKLRVQTRGELIKLHRKLGVTTIYVTHDQIEAMTMGQRIAVMKDGVLQQCDEPLKIYQNPANVFVAGFIGTPSMNFLSARVTQEGSTPIVDVGQFKLRLPADRTAALQDYIGKNVILGIRPETVFDKALPPAARDAQHLSDAFIGTVEVVEAMGARSLVTLQLGEQSLAADLEKGTSAQAGETLQIQVDTAAVHLFDPETEVAIV